VAHVGLVVVSHSRLLAEAAVALAREMLGGQQVDIAVAAGLDDGTLGTDATAIAEAVTAADSGDGVVVLMDLGSAVLSAELALEFLDDGLRDRVLLCPAALVEGLVGATVTAGGGAGREQVAAEALGALAAKQAHLAPAEPVTTEPVATEPVTTEAPASAGPAAGSFTVEGAHGLHARPAARLVQLAGSLDADLEVRNATTGSDWTSATSLSGVTALGVQQGHEVQVRASGPGADRAVEQLIALVGRGLADDAGPAPAPAAQPGAAAVPASPGIGIGPARVLRPAPRELPGERAGDPAAERVRLDAARDRCREEIRRTRNATAATLGETAAAIFDAHLLFVDDAALLDDAYARIGAGEPAAAAWAAAVDRVHGALAALDNDYLQARAADVRAVGDQVLDALSGSPTDDRPEAAAAGVLVAEDLPPARAALLDPERITGVVLAAGSPTAHSAQLIRAHGVPAVVAAGMQVLQVPDGTLIALDGRTGELLLDPDEEELTALRGRATDPDATSRDRGQ
jgi:multiphosphoryl transfer protein